MANKLYVANLAYQTTANQLRDLLSRAGEVEEVDMAMDHETRLSRGYAYVQMSTEDGAAEAIRLFNKQLVGDRQLIVSQAIRQTN